MPSHSNVVRAVFVVLLVVLIAGCGQPQPTVTSQVEPTAAPTSQPTAQPVAEESNGPMLVAFGYSSVKTDNGWTYVHDQGRLALEKALPNVKTTYVEMLPYSEEASRTLEQFIKDGAKFIIVAAEYGEYVYKVAEDYPDIPFLEANGHAQSDNVSSYYFEHTMVDYLLGMAAGLLTKSNKIGFVTSFPVPINYAEANAFQLGAQSVNPNVTTHVVLINAWFDPQAHRQAAEALMDDGVDFVFSNLDDPSAVQAGGERGVWVASAWTDRRSYAPNQYVSGLMVDWGPFYISEVESVMAGTWKGNRSVILPLGGGLDIGPWGDNVPQGVRDSVEAVRQKMLNEGFNPFVGPLKDGKGVVRVPKGQVLTAEDRRTKWDWPLEGVIGMPEE
jgi:basic membrane protein A